MLQLQEPEPEPEQAGAAQKDVAAALATEAKALAPLDDLQAERDAEDRAQNERVRSTSCTPGILYGLPGTDSLARNRTTELLGKIGSLKKDVAQLDEELGWETARAESAEGAARTARARIDAEARAAAKAAAIERAQREAEAETAARAEVLAAAAARQRAQQDAEQAAREAEAAAQAAAARRAAADMARQARLDGALDRHGERWRDAGESGYAALIQRAYRRHKLKVDTVAALLQKEDEEFLAAQRCVGT